MRRRRLVSPSPGHIARTMLCSCSVTRLPPLERSRRSLARRIAFSRFLTPSSLLISSGSLDTSTRRGAVAHAGHSVEGSVTRGAARKGRPAGSISEKGGFRLQAFVLSPRTAPQAVL